MKKILILCLVTAFLICSCGTLANKQTNSASGKQDADIVGKWVDTQTEQTVEFTSGGFYYEYINESFNSVKTRYITENGKLYYYLDGDSPDMNAGIDYEIKDGNLVIAGVLEYKPLNIKTSSEE